MDPAMWVRSGAALLTDIDRVETPEGSLAIWYLGQMGLVVKGAGMIIYLDPYLVESWTKDASGQPISRRRFPPPFAGADVYHAGIVLGTHNHSDHINVPTLTGMSIGSLQARFVVPAPHTHVLIEAGISKERVVGARVGQPLQWGDLTVTPIPAAHEELEQDVQGNYTALGYILKLNGVTLYHAGDTVEYPGLIDTLKDANLDICFLPINGRDMLRRNRNIVGNMNFREAVDVGYAAGARLLIPGHHDVFPHNGENPAFFADYLYRSYPSQPFKIMVPGERIIYMH